MTFYRKVDKFYLTFLHFHGSNLPPSSTDCHVFHFMGTPCRRFSQGIYIHVEMNVRSVCTLRAKIASNLPLQITPKPQLDTHPMVTCHWIEIRKERKKYNDSLTPGKSNRPDCNIRLCKPN